MSPVILAIVTENKKLRGCSATYVAQQSCPECVLRGNGCYAETGPMAWSTTFQLNKVGKDKTPFQLAQIERRMIQEHAADLDAIGRPLRLHVVGDCRTPAAAGEVAKGAEVWNKTTGGKVWTYTHAWGKVGRKHWGDVSVLASIEDIRDLPKAWHRGYAPAMIVPRFENGAKAWKLGEWNVIPCPEQTLGIGCRKCGLCMKDSWLRESKSVIGFRPHGARAKTVLTRLGHREGKTMTHIDNYTIYSRTEDNFRLCGEVSRRYGLKAAIHAAKQFPGGEVWAGQQQYWAGPELTARVYPLTRKQALANIAKIHADLLAEGYSLDAGYSISSVYGRRGVHCVCFYLVQCPWSQKRYRIEGSV